MIHQPSPNDIASDLLQTLSQYFQCFKPSDDFATAVTILSKTQGNILISGLGKSGHVAKLIVATLQSLNIRSIFLHAGEALHGDLGLMNPQDTLVMLSHSGKTHECLSVWSHAKKLKLACISITSNPHSILARTADAALTYAPKELCLWQRVPSISTLAMHLYGELLAMTLQRLSSYSEDDYLISHCAGSHGKDAILIHQVYLPLEQTAQVYVTASLQSTLEEIQKYKLGSALILDEHNHLAGIFTDGDLRRALLKNAKLQDNIAMWMIPSPQIILDSMTLGEAKKLFIEKKITSAPVKNNHGVTLGLITHHQLELQP